MTNFPTWHILAHSVRGASHVKNGLNNQDFGWPIGLSSAQEAVLVVADGHGSVKSFRSNIGSRLAGISTRAVLQDFILRCRKSDTSLSAIKEWAEIGLPKEIVRSWGDKVECHFADNPFKDDELSNLQDRDIEALRKNPKVAYGSTLLCVLATSQFIIYAQLGDGDILAVTDTGVVSRPIPKDERLIANETTSLCLPKAWDDFQVKFQPTSIGAPALIMLSTDGYANSFSNESEFTKAGPDLLNLLREEGIEYVDKNLTGWLNEASQLGSGDDVTLGICVDCNIQRSD